MRRVIAVCLFLVCTRDSARANEEPSHYLELTSASGIGPGGLELLGGLAGGLQLARHHWLRLAIVGGPTTWDDQDGYIVAARIGYERRGCTENGVLCAFVGLDLGSLYARQSYSDLDATGRYLGALVIPRTGVELGDAQFRLRLGFETGFADWTAISGHVPSAGAIVLAATLGCAFPW